MTSPGEVVPLGVGLALLGAFALAGQSLTVRYGTRTSRSADAMVTTLAANLVVFVPAAFAVGDPLEELTAAAVLAFAGAGVAGAVVARALLFEGIKRVGSSRAEPVKASQPLWATLIAVVVLGEVVSGGHVLAMAAIVAGIAVITREHGRREGTAEGRAWVGLAFPFAAAVFFGLEPTFAKLGLADGAGVLTGLLVKTVAATIAYGAYRSWREGLPRPGRLDRRELPWLAGAGLCNTGFLLAYYGALQLERVSVVVPLVQLSPLVVIAVSALAVSDDLEPITWPLVAGAVVTVVGAVGVTLLA